MFIALAVAFVLTACNSNDDMPEADATGTVANITFNVQGDFTLTTSPMTRALTSDGKDMTDVWVFDYVGDELKQQVHQTGEDKDFGQPTIALPLGEHHLYFVATRSNGATINTEVKTMTFAKVSDTFWRYMPLTISNGGSANRTVALDRIVTKLRLTFLDAVPYGTASINITPVAWYYGFNYATGNPVAAVSSHEISIATPASIYGLNEQSASVYGFSSSTEWTTDLSFNSKNTDGNLIGAATITAAPFVRNRVTEYTGTFWTAGGGMTMSLNAAWDDPYQGTW